MKQWIQRLYPVALAVLILSGCGAGCEGNSDRGSGNPGTGSARIFDAVVDINGSGDYTSLQEAINSTPDNRTEPWKIFIKNGVYEELIRIPKSKRFVHLIGQEKEKTIVSYTIHCGSPDDPEWEASYNNPENPAHGTFGSVVIIQAPDFYAENISFINRFGVERQSGPQALAIRSDNDRHAFYNCDMRSFQDTWRTSTGNISDRHYALDCHIEGAVDYIYGAGDVLVERCVLYNVRSGSVIVAPSHKPGTRWGYVFDRCAVDGNRKAADGKQLLGRPWHNSPIAVFLNTTMEIDIDPAGWTNMGVIPKLFAEYGSTDKNGKMLDLSQRKSEYQASEAQGGNTGTSQTVLTAEEASVYTYENVLKGRDNWDPRLYMERLPAPGGLQKKGNRLVWKETPEASGYVVFRDGILLGSTYAASFTDSDAAEEKSYRYEVKAVNRFGGIGAPVSL